MKSQAQKLWELKGVTQEISLKVGNLNEWDLKRSIISHGILLYGRVKQVPEEAEFYTLLQLSYKNISQNQKLRFWRKLFGHKQKTGEKTYTSPGLLNKVKGKRIENGIIVPAQNEKEMRDFLKKHKVPCTLHELWSDSL